MAGYIGSKASVVSSGAERKKTFAISTTTTSLTGLSYTPTYVHVFHNGVRLVDGSDFTATNGTSITLSNSAVSGDEVVVISYSSFQVADHYNKTESDTRFINTAGDTLTGTLGGTAVNLSGDLAAVNTTLTGYLRGPATFTIDPAAHADDTGLVIIAGNLQVDGSTTTINSTTLTVDDLNLTLASGAADSAAANGAGITIDGASASLLYSHSGTKFVFNKALDVGGELASTGNLSVGIGNSKEAFIQATNSGRVASNPAYSFRSDPDTGMFNPNTDNTIAFATGGSERLRINSDGFMVYTGNMQLQSTAQTGYLTVSGGNNSNNGANITMYGPSHDSLANMIRFRDGATINMVIDADGNVGIGTASPTTVLTIRKAIASAAYGQQASMIEFKSYYAGYDTETVKSAIYSGVSNQGTLNTQGGYMAFHVNNNGTMAEKLRIEKSGHVGIGITNPSSMLHVQSNNSTTNDAVNMMFLTALSTGTTTTGFGPAIVLQAERNSGVNQNVGKIRSVAEVNSGTNISSGLSFETGTAGVLNERMRITHGGHVGINVVSPQRQFVLYSTTASGQTNMQFQNSTTGTAAGDGFGVGMDAAEKGFIWNYESNDTYFGGTTSGTVMNISGANGNVKIGALATGSATSAPLHVAKASTDVQAIFGDNNSSIDDPQIQVIGRNTANNAIRYAFFGLDADANHARLGYNSGAGGFTYAIRMDSAGNVGLAGANPNVHGQAVSVNGKITGGFGGRTTGGTEDYNHVTNSTSGNGYSLLTAGATNGPGTGSYYHVFNFEYVSSDGSGNVTQWAIGYNTLTRYQRYRYDGNWSSWGAF